MLLSVVTFLVVLSILVLVHEFGHFVLARLLGIGVDEFAIGLPLTKPLFSKKTKDGLLISIYPALFGGFVRLLGEEFEDQGKAKGQTEAWGRMAFWNRQVWVRLVVIVAGVASNVVLAVMAFSLVVFFSGIPVKTNQVKVVGVAPGSPAEQVGLKVGDVVIGVEQTPLSTPNNLVAGKAVTSSEEFIRFISGEIGKTVELDVMRDGREMRVNIVPRANPPKGEGSLGVVISDNEIQFPPFPKRVIESLKLGVKETWSWTVTTLAGVGYLVSQLVTGRVPTDIAGPVGIAQMSGMVAKEGILAVVQFLGLLSVNLAVLNILPFPALDGGRVLFIAIESIFGRRVAPKIEHWVHTVGMVILLTFMLFITIRDIERIIKESGFFLGGIPFIKN